MATTSSHTLNTVRSPDGTAIAFERLGAGDPVVVIGGATCDRARTRPLAEELARHFTVLNYDREAAATAATRCRTRSSASSRTSKH
jgi:hypothetical protein